MDINLSSINHFEPLHGRSPKHLLESHPDEALAIMRVVAENYRWRSAVWNIQTGALIWAPPEAYLMAWCNKGKEIGVVYEQINSPLETKEQQVPIQQRMRIYTWKRFSWPDFSLINSHFFPPTTDALFRFVISPCSDLAVFHWESTHREILDFLSLSQKMDAPFEVSPFPSNSYLVEHQTGGRFSGYLFDAYSITRPVFCPDGRYLLVGWEAKWYWWPGPDEEDEFEEYDDGTITWEEFWKQPEGDCYFGVIVMFDWKTHQIKTLPLSAPIPSDWKPPEWGQEAADMHLSDPIFLDNDHFRLRLPTGEQKTYTLPNTENL